MLQMIISIMWLLLMFYSKTLVAYPLQDHIYQKKDFNKFIIHRNETIRVDLRDYISGSFLDFDMSIWNTDVDPPARIVNNSCISLSAAYKEINRIETPDQPVVFPMLKNAITFVTEDQQGQDTEFLLYISPSVEIVINRRELFVLDLKPTIRDYISHFSIEDLFCNNLVEVTSKELFVLPWKMFDDSFIVWMKMAIEGPKFLFSVFAQRSIIMIDKNGRNSLDTFYINDDLYILSSSGEKPDLFCLTRVDVSTFGK